LIFQVGARFSILLNGISSMPIILQTKKEICNTLYFTKWYFFYAMAMIIVNISTTINSTGESESPCQSIRPFFTGSKLPIGHYSLFLHSHLNKRLNPPASRVKSFILSVRCKKSHLLCHMFLSKSILKTLHFLVCSLC
jgi:hypothetical protein